MDWIRSLFGIDLSLREFIPLDSYRIQFQTQNKWATCHRTNSLSAPDKFILTAVSNRLAYELVMIVCNGGLLLKINQ